MASADSVVVENLQYDGVMPEELIVKDPTNNQPNGVYVMLTQGVKYKKPNAYGMSFYIQIVVIRKSTSAIRVGDWNAVDGVPFSDIEQVRWELVDDDNRVSVLGKTSGRRQ